MGENRVTMSLIKRYVSVMLVAALVLTGIQIPTFAAEAKTEEITLTVGEQVQLDVSGVPVTKEAPTKTTSGDVPTSDVPTSDVPTTSNDTPEVVNVEWVWTVDGKDVVSVTDAGKVKALEEGKAVVKLTADTVTKVWNIEVVAKTTTAPNPTTTPDGPGGATTAPNPTTTPDGPGGATGTPAPTTTPDGPGGATGTPAPTTTPEGPTPTDGADLTGTPTPTNGADVTGTPAPTNGADVTGTPAPTGKVTVTPEPTKKPTAKPTQKPETAKSIKLNASKLTLAKKASVTLTATVKASNASLKKVTWKSSKPSVATVKKGKVTARKKGTTTITATAGGKTAKCKITVLPGASYKITYKLSKGKNNGLNPSYIAKGQKVTFKAPTRKGYTFKGWYVNNKKVKSIKGSKKVTVTAKWTKVKVSATKLKSVKGGSKKITVKYNKVKGVKGYEIKYSTSKKFTTKTTKAVTTSKTSKTIKNLTKGTYYVKVRAYKLDSAGNKVYSKATAAKKVTVK